MGDGGLHPGHEGLKDAPLLAHQLLDEGAFGDHGVHSVTEELLIHAQQGAGLEDKLLIGQIGVPVFHPGVLESVLDARKQPGGGVGLEAGYPLSDGVGSHKADAVDVVYELVGVLLDLAQGQIPIGFVHAIGLVHRDAVGGQGHEDVPHGPIFVEGAGDHLQLLLADAGNLQQSFRFLLHDLQGVHAEPGHDEAGHGGTDALHVAAGQVVLDGQLGGGGQGLGKGDDELLAVFRVILDGALRPKLLPGGGKGQGAAQCHEAVGGFGAQRQNGVPVVGVSIYDPVDDAHNLHIIQIAAE